MNNIRGIIINGPGDIFAQNQPTQQELQDLNRYFEEPYNIALVVGRTHTQAVNVRIQAITPFMARIRAVPSPSAFAFLDNQLRTLFHPFGQPQSNYTQIRYNGRSLARVMNDPILPLDGIIHDQTVMAIGESYNNTNSIVRQYIRNPNFKVINPPTEQRNYELGDVPTLTSTFSFPFINIPIGMLGLGLHVYDFDVTHDIMEEPGQRIRITSRKIKQFARKFSDEMYSSLQRLVTRFETSLQTYRTQHDPNLDIPLIYLSASIRCDWFGARTFHHGTQQINGVDIPYRAEQSIIDLDTTSRMGSAQLIYNRANQQIVANPQIATRQGVLIPAFNIPQLDYLAKDFLFSQVVNYMTRALEMLENMYDPDFLNFNNVFCYGWGFNFTMLELNPDDTFSILQMPAEIPISTFNLRASRDDIPYVFQLLIKITPIRPNEKCAVQALQNFLAYDIPFREETVRWIHYLKHHDFTEDAFMHLFGDIQMNYIIIFRNYTEFKLFYPRPDLPAIVIFADISHCEITDHPTLTSWIKKMHSRFGLCDTRGKFLPLMKRFYIDFTKENKQTSHDDIFFLDLETDTKGERKAYLLVFGNSANGWISFKGASLFEDFVRHLRGMSYPTVKKTKKQGVEYKRNIIIYSFNGGRFDYMYLLPYITGQIAGTMTDIKYLKFDTANCSFMFADLARTLSGSLKNLAINYGLKNRKIEISLPETAPEVGTPEFAEVEKYCIMDCMVLEELLFKFVLTITTIMNEDLPAFNKTISPNNKRIHAKRPWVFKHPCISAAGLALNIYKTGSFIRDFQTGETPKGQFMPMGLFRCEYNNVLPSYFGGHTMVYCPIAEDGIQLYYYDINSSYPHSMMSEVPLSSIEQTSRFHLPEFDLGIYMNDPDCKKYMALNYIEFEFPQDYPFPSIPVRINEGLIWPSHGVGYVWDDHLAWLIRKIPNFKMKQLSRLTFIKGRIFNNYIDTWYSKKSSTNDPLRRDLYKKLLNSLYGKFGQQEFLEKHIVNNETMLEWLKLGNIKEIRDLGNGKYLLTPPQSNVHPQHIGSMIHIASYITSLSRLHLFKQMHKIHFKLGGKVYYCDTDSIFSSVPFPDKDISSSQLGKWKLECMGLNCLFFGSKSYYYQDEKGVDHLKFKGIPTAVMKENKQILTRELFGKASSVHIDTTWQRKYGFVLNKEMDKQVRATLTRRCYNEDKTGSRPWKDVEEYRNNLK